MSHDQFINDLNHAALKLGKEALAKKWGVSLKTIHRYLTYNTKPQLRLILKYYQSFYCFDRRPSEIIPHTHSDICSEILFELCFRSIRIDQVENQWGLRGKQTCAQLLRNDMIEIKPDRTLKINPLKAFMKNIIIQTLYQLKVVQTEDDKCHFHSLHLNQQGYERLQVLVQELNNKIIQLTSNDSYRGEHSVFLYNFSGKLTSLLSN
jgi:hypothetical protein